MKGIGDGRYIHIFTSPEMVVSQAFSLVMTRSNQDSFVTCVTVDESHLITKWGNLFRPGYDQLNTFR
jgi:superfamily II DNA helicase RecQ